jgi:hypothetical protein
MNETPHLHGPATAAVSGSGPSASRGRVPGGWATADTLALLLVVGLAVLTWVPRSAGPLDLRWDAAVYYILGTSLAEGRGYKLLNEPGDIDAVQYPPLLPAVVAVHQLVLGTDDPTTVGRWLRLTAFLLFVGYAAVVFLFARSYLRRPHAVLASLLAIFSLFTWFLSDALFTEVWFSAATVLFLSFARTDGSRVHGALAYVFAVASYLLRTIGLAAFVVWIADSLLRRRFRQALVRTALALVPVVGWQGYVLAVERSPEYVNPAYEYQRAPYMFYNVSYAKNIRLRDPFTPEKGEVHLVRRVVRNTLRVPVNLAGTLSASPGYFERWSYAVLGDGPVRHALVHWGAYGLLSLIGGVLVFGGMLLQVARRQWLVPLYIATYVGAMCLAPFPGEYLRYLMPIAPLLAVVSMVFLVAVGRAWAARDGRAARFGPALPFAVLGAALAVQVGTAVSVYAAEYQPISYVDRSGRPVSYRLFFYAEAHAEFDRAIDYVRDHAAPTDVVAAGTPHWIYLRTGLESVMPPFGQDAARTQALLDSVPVAYLIVGKDVVATERYTRPALEQFPDAWERVHTTPKGHWDIYRRVRR